MSSYWGQIPSKVVRQNRTNSVYTGRVESAKMHKLRDPATGELYEVPDDDYRQYLGQKQDKSIEKHVSEAFGPNAQVEVIEPRATGGDTGHIIKLEYAVLYKILRVTFKKPSREGQVVAYMNVPSPIAGELLHHAYANPVSSDSKGVLRHVLGKRFWDLIRIRGTLHGTRYPFKYVDGDSSGGDSYTKGTATPDWSKTNFVLVKSPSGNYVPKAVDKLDATERSNMESRTNLSQHADPNKQYDVDRMMRLVKFGPIEDSAKQSILSELNKIKNTSSNAGFTMYNYLRNMGLL